MTLLYQINPPCPIYLKRSISRFNDEIQFEDRYFVDIGIRSIGIVCIPIKNFWTKIGLASPKYRWGLELVYERFGLNKTFSYIVLVKDENEAKSKLNLYRKAFSEAKKV